MLTENDFNEGGWSYGTLDEVAPAIRERLLDIIFSKEVNPHDAMGYMLGHFTWDDYRQAQLVH